MHKSFLILGALFAMLGVVIGAFGAHALKSTLEIHGRSDTFETAVKYQFYHSLGLILLGFLMTQFEHKAFLYSGWGFICGILLFSGSLYTLSLTGITKLGAVAPIGGLSFIIGWLMLIWGVIKSI